MTVTLDAIEPHRLYRQIADRIGALIAGGEYPPGTRLPPERDLAAQLQVSRTSVREALIALELGGLIDIRMGSGIYVRDQRGAAMHLVGQGDKATGPFEQLRARWLIEGQTAALAAKNASLDDVAALRELSSQMREYRPHSRDVPDRLFHVRIAEASGNSVLALVVEFLWEQRKGPLWAQIEKHFHTPALLRQSVDDHQAIIRAISARDAPGARRAMRSHLNRVSREFARGWRPARTKAAKAGGKASEET
ncbi:MAG: FadR family transcriptional regulator [Betaproteobacteria bacterium]|nr:FadR family transcriptional regulator [Betaproteobacteria bacterium]MBK9606333.1 FadR family transcriptional regulator [Betaproteobacteria bacterium]